MLTPLARSRFFLALACALLLSACDAHPSAIGVARDAHTSQIVILYRPCHDRSALSRLSVSTLTGDKSRPTATKIWEITAAASSHERRFILGFAPTGFSESVALTAEPSGELIIDLADSELESDSEVFLTDRLRAGMVYVPNGGYTTEEQFFQRNTCG